MHQRNGGHDKINGRGFFSTPINCEGAISYAMALFSIGNIGVGENAEDEMEHTNGKAANTGSETQVTGHTENQDADKDQPDATADELGEHLEVFMDQSERKLAHKANQCEQQCSRSHACHRKGSIEVEHAVLAGMVLDAIVAVELVTSLQDIVRSASLQIGGAVNGENADDASDHHKEIHETCQHLQHDAQRQRHATFASSFCHFCREMMLNKRTE